MTQDTRPNTRPTALALPPDAEPTEAVKAYFAKCQEKLGFIPNVLAAYAFDTAKLQAFIDMADNLMLADSGLSKLEREMIAVVVSSINHCHYCLTAHGAAVRQRGKSAVLGDLMVHNFRAADLTARQRQMLEFTAKLTEHPDKMGEADRAALRAEGFTDRDIWDIAAVASFYNMSNRLAAAVEMRPNAQYFGMAREL